MDSPSSPKLFYGWVVVLGSFIAIFSGGLLFSYGVFFDTLRTEFGWDYATTSSIYSVTLVLSLIFTIAWGPIIDRYGSKIPLLVSALSTGIGFILVSRSQNLWQFYLFRSVGCIGASTMTVALTAVQKWFIKKRGLVVTISIAGLGVGQFTYPLLSGHLISTYGWRAAFIIIGLVNAFLILCAAQLIVDSPEEKGMMPYGADMHLSEGMHKKTDAIRWEKVDFDLWEALKTPSFIAISLYNLLTVIPVHITYVHLVPYTIKTGLASFSTASISLSIIGGMSIAGRLLFGAITPHISGWRQGLAMCPAFCGIMMLWLTGSNALWMIWTFAFIFGIFQGGRTPLVPGIIGTYYGTKSLASLIAISNATMIVGAAIGPIIGGLVCDHTGNYPLAFFIGALCYIGGAFSVLKITPPKKSSETPHLS